MRYSLPLLAAVILMTAACASPTAYKPAAKAGGAGYSDTRIETDRYRVSFSTAAGGAQAAQDMALRRAADLTLQQGYDWFEVTQRDTEVNRNSGSSFSLGVGTASIGRSSAVGIGTSVGIPVGAGPAATTTLEIRMGKGAKPDSSNAYDARGVQASYAGRN